MRVSLSSAAAIAGLAMAASPAAAQSLDSTFVEELCKTIGSKSMNATQSVQYETVTAVRYNQDATTWYAFRRGGGEDWCEMQYSRTVQGNVVKVCQKATVTKTEAQLVRGSWTGVTCATN